MNQLTKTKPISSLTKGTLTIAFKDRVLDDSFPPRYVLGTRTRPALFFRGLAVHFEEYGKLPALYVVSHERTGMAIARFGDRSNALLALKLLGLITNWPELTKDSDFESLRYQVTHILQPLKDDDPYYQDDDEGCC